MKRLKKILLVAMFIAPSAIHSSQYMKTKDQNDLLKVLKEKEDLYNKAAEHFLSADPKTTPTPPDIAKAINELNTIIRYYEKTFSDAPYIIRKHNPENFVSADVATRISYDVGKLPDPSLKLPTKITSSYPKKQILVTLPTTDRPATAIKRQVAAPARTAVIRRQAAATEQRPASAIRRQVAPITRVEKPVTPIKRQVAAPARTAVVRRQAIATEQQPASVIRRQVAPITRVEKPVTPIKRQVAVPARPAVIRRQQAPASARPAAAIKRQATPSTSVEKPMSSLAFLETTALSQVFLPKKDVAFITINGKTFGMPSINMLSEFSTFLGGSIESETYYFSGTQGLNSAWLDTAIEVLKSDGEDLYACKPKLIQLGQYLIAKYLNAIREFDESITDDFILNKTNEVESLVNEKIPAPTARPAIKKQPATAIKRQVATPARSTAIRRQGTPIEERSAATIKRQVAPTTVKKQIAGSTQARQTERQSIDGVLQHVLKTPENILSERQKEIIEGYLNKLQKVSATRTLNLEEARMLNRILSTSAPKEQAVRSDSLPLSEDEIEALTQFKVPTSTSGTTAVKRQAAPTEVRRQTPSSAMGVKRQTTTTAERPATAIRRQRIAVRRTAEPMALAQRQPAAASQRQGEAQFTKEELKQAHFNQPSGDDLLERLPLVGQWINFINKPANVIYDRQNQKIKTAFIKGSIRQFPKGATPDTIFKYFYRDILQNERIIPRHINRQTIMDKLYAELFRYMQ